MSQQWKKLLGHPFCSPGEAARKSFSPFLTEPASEKPKFVLQENGNPTALWYSPLLILFGGSGSLAQLSLVFLCLGEEKKF